MWVVVMFAPFLVAYYSIMCLRYPTAVAEVLLDDLKERIENFFNPNT